MDSPFSRSGYAGVGPGGIAVWRQIGQIRRDGPKPGVAIGGEHLHVRQIGHGSGDLAGEVVVADEKTSKLCHLAKLGWELSTQVVVAQFQGLEVGQIPKFGWNWTAKFITVKVEKP